MGTFVFKWDHPATEVYVTGTFDDWSKSEKLSKIGDSFSKEVTLSSAANKIYYKFVVDGNWVTDHTAPQENDASGNLNNVLTPERISKHAPATSGVMAATGASSDVPGTFPETPAAVEKDGEQAFSVNPLPATDGAVNPIKLAPGEQVPHPSTFTGNTVTSGVYDDPELVAADKAKGESEQIFRVAPLPAFPGAVNPVQVAPGQALPPPNTVTDQTLSSAVRLDKESYENSGALGYAPVLPPVVTPQDERDAKGTGILDLPPVSKNMISESSLPIAPVEAKDAVPTIQSAGAETTTAALAGAVPLESSKVPDVVKDSQEQAGVAPEASAIPEEVKEKSDVEKELLKEVPQAPATSDSAEPTKPAAVSPGEAAAAVGAAAVAAGGAAVAYAAGAADKLPESVTAILPESVRKSINDINAKSAESTAAEAVPAESLAKDTPQVVKDSIAESGKGPEAAANEEAVIEKKAVEKELLSEVKKETSSGEPAPTAAATSTLTAPAPTKPAESREVSPGTVPGDHTQTQTAPVVTTGVASATTTETSKPAAAAPASSTTTGNGSTAEEKKKKRGSIFGRIKAKFSDKK